MRERCGKSEGLDFLKVTFSVRSAVAHKLLIMRRQPKSVLLSASVLGLGLLAGCAANGPSNLKVHEVNLSGGANERIVWVYGNLNGSASSVKLGGAAADLRPQVQDALATPGSLSVNGKAVYRTPLTPVNQKMSVVRDPSGQFIVTPMNNAVLSATYFTDGQRWFKLSAPGGKVTAQPSVGLRGAGQLTDDEADALAAALSGQGNMAVAVGEAAGAAAGVAVEPAPTESRRTDLYLLPNVQTVAAPAENTTGGTMTPSTPVTPALAGGLNFTPLARGTNANASAPSVRTATTAAQLQTLYAVAYGRQTTVPTPPTLNNETVVAVFMGQRNTGGYSVNVEEVSTSGSTLNVRVRFTAPGPDVLTTQALTSPWVMIKVPGVFTSVNVVDSAGNPIR